MRELQTVRVGQLSPALGITPAQEREVLSRLARRNLIARVRRGLYLVPPRLPPGGRRRETAGHLRQQVQGQLKPVLRRSDFTNFDLDHAFETVRRFAKLLAP